MNKSQSSLYSLAFSMSMERSQLVNLMPTFTMSVIPASFCNFLMAEDSLTMVSASLAVKARCPSGRAFAPSCMSLICLIMPAMICSVEIVMETRSSSHFPSLIHRETVCLVIPTFSAISSCVHRLLMNKSLAMLFLSMLLFTIFI